MIVPRKNWRFTQLITIKFVMRVNIRFWHEADRNQLYVLYENLLPPAARPVLRNRLTLNTTDAAEATTAIHRA